MEKVTKQINLESLRSRKIGLKYTTLTATTINIPILLDNNVDDMGIFSNVEFIPYINGVVDYSVLNDKLSILFSGETFEFQVNPFVAIDSSGYEYFIRDVNKLLDEYFISGYLISGQTESRKSEVRSYEMGNPFSIGYITDNGVYVNYDNNNITFVNKVLSVNPLIYVIDGGDDLNLGTDLQNGGFIFIENQALINPLLINNSFLFNGDNKESITNELDVTLVNDLTIIKYKNEGFNETNSTLSALTKDEMYYGLIHNPKINNDVFINRGITQPIEMHFRFNEIKSLNHLERYGNGFFNINKL
jgi:hypothetical protein